VREYSAGKAKHEKDDSHFAAGDKGSEAREQTKRDEEAAHQFNPAAPIAPSFCCGISTRREVKNFLSTVTSKHEPDNHPRDAIDGIGETLEQVHNGSLSPLDSLGKRTIQAFRDHEIEVQAIATTMNGKPVVQNVRVGDKLLQVDNVVLRDATRGAIFSALHGKPGSTRTLLLERDGKQMRVPVLTNAF
jgi:hypothetical protein